MTLRTGHGTGAGVPRIETIIDELPVGVPDPNPVDQAAVQRDPGGRLVDSHGAQMLGAKGGKAKAGKTRLAARLGLTDTCADPRFLPYLKAARAFRSAQVAELARSVGGGFCGPAEASMVASGALQLAASRFAFEVLGDFKLGSSLATDSRQSLAMAHEYCAKSARARPPSLPSWLQTPKEKT